jgi:methionine-rich copper-binding protein CopC
VRLMNESDTSHRVVRYVELIPAISVAICFLLALLASPLLFAQHDMHGMSDGESLLVSSMPADDEVLAEAPKSIMLGFDSEVRLVKLALKETKQGEILIDFRYDSEAAMRYVQSLPSLAEANYYKIEWAALNMMGELIRGSFYFSFGEQAKPPSSYRDEMDHNMLIPSPDYRLL